MAKEKENEEEEEEASEEQMQWRVVDEVPPKTYRSRFIDEFAPIYNKQKEGAIVELKCINNSQAYARKNKLTRLGIEAVRRGATLYITRGKTTIEI